MLFCIPNFDSHDIQPLSVPHENNSDRPTGGPELSQEKTKITHISEGFDFLGQNVRKYDGKLLIKSSTTNVKAFLDKVRETIRMNRSAKQETLTHLLNPVIRGWANYHRHVVAKRAY